MINWRYVKGLNQNNGDSDLYTFLSFHYAENSDDDSLNHFENVPSLHINATNAFTGATDLGHIITQKATGQSIDVPFSFTNELTTYDKIYIYNSNGVDEHSDNDDVIYFKERFKDENDQWVDDVWARIYMYTNTDSTDPYPDGAQRLDLDIKKNFGIFDLYHDRTVCNINCMWEDPEDIAKEESGEKEAPVIDIWVNGMLRAANKCEAVYFNATSDKRAKTNLKPLSINALDLINRVQLYSFKYKDSDLPSIGILAQDIQDVNIEGFDLVDNKQASGINMDYMSIHESKLIYVLWKAIQEQQKEIKELKSKIK